MAACDAPVYRLALAALRGDVATRVASLRCVSGVHQHNLCTSAARRIAQGDFEAVPPLVQNGPIESSLLPYILAGLVNRACRTRGHTPSVQVFEHDHAVSGGNAVRGPCTEVPTPVCGMPDHLPHSNNRPATILRTLLLPGQLALQPQAAGSLPSSDEYTVVEFAGAGRGRNDNATIHADDRAWVGVRGRAAVLHEERNIPVPPLPRHRGRPHLATERARPTKAHPPKLREPDSPPFPADSLDNDARAVRKAERWRPAVLGPPAHPECAVLPAGPVEITECLLQHMRGCSTQPLELTLRLSQLGSLRNIVHPGPATPVFPPLLQSGIPHRAADVAELFALLLLSGREHETVLPTGQHGSLLPTMPTDVTGHEVTGRLDLIRSDSSHSRATSIVLLLSPHSSARAPSSLICR